MLSTLTVMAISMTTIVGINFGATAAIVVAPSTLPGYIIAFVTEWKKGGAR
jgi:hypothetical protein